MSVHWCSQSVYARNTCIIANYYQRGVARAHDDIIIIPPRRSDDMSSCLPPLHGENLGTRLVNKNVLCQKLKWLLQAPVRPRSFQVFLPFSYS